MVSTIRMVALLRGINVGRAKRIAMADLRALVEGLGYSGVATLLNSGNIVFSAADATANDTATRIESAIATQLGVQSRVTILTSAEIAEIVAENPFATIAEDPSRFMISVFYGPADRARVEPLLSQDWSPDLLALGRRVAYVWCPNGLLSSQLMDVMARALRDGVTTRNWATIQKLHALCAP